MEQLWLREALRWPRLKRLLFWMLGVGLADQGSGWWARQALAHHHVIWIIHPYLSFQLLYNTGAMLGLGARFPVLITAIGVIGTVILVGLALASRRYFGPAAMMASGALGNVISRLAQGRVTDFVRVSGWPGIFNLSDVALRVGVLWMFWRMIRTERSSPAVAPDASKAPTRGS